MVRIKTIPFKKVRNTNIVFVNPIAGIFYSSLFHFVKHNTTITVAGFLFSNKSNRVYLNLRKAFVNFAYNTVDNIVIYSSREVDYYSRLFPKLADKFIFVKYGKDYPETDMRISTSNDYCFSGGASNRDYTTLLKAFSIAEDTKCVIATRPYCITGENIPNNVSVRYDITIESFGTWIAKSNIFILSLADVELSAGHMAMLEAMKHGKIIIINDIPAIRDYVSENEVIFYPSGDSKILAEKIIWATSNLDSEEIKTFSYNTKVKYQRDYTFFSLLKRLIEITDNR